MLLLTATTGLVAATTARSAPSIAELRSQVAQIEAEVAAIDNQVEAAAEAYNGAVYRLGQIQERIGANTATLRKAQRDLAKAREILGARIRAAYIQPPPTRIQLILSSGSVSTFLGGSEALERASSQDASVVRSVRALQQRAVDARRQLLKDRQRANDEVASRASQRAVVLRLLNQRAAVLSSAKGRLGQALAAEQARKRREAAAEQRRALQRLRATSNAVTPDPTPAAPASPSPAAPSPAPTRPGAGNGGGAAVSGGSGSAANAQAARIALQYLGVPYVWGGASPSGFDCSGLASYAYAKVGKSVPHYTVAIWNAFPRVTGPLQPGDLVFFRGLGHMGIYIGGGNMVNAPQTGDVVRIRAMSSRSDYVGAVRP